MQCHSVDSKCSSKRLSTVHKLAAFVTFCPKKPSHGSAFLNPIKAFRVQSVQLTQDICTLRPRSLFDYLAVSALQPGAICIGDIGAAPDPPDRFFPPFRQSRRSGSPFGAPPRLLHKRHRRVLVCRFPSLFSSVAAACLAA